MEEDNGTVQSHVEYLGPCSAIFPLKLTVTSFAANVAVPPASRMEAIESIALTKVGNTCTILAVVGRVGKSKIPLWVAVIVVFSGRMTFGPVVVGFTLSNGASVLR